MPEVYIFSQDDNMLTVISDSTGLVSTLFKDQLNGVPDEPFSFSIEADVVYAKHVKEEEVC
ncbi:hypothetical protein ACFSCZ_12585 [Siminovitchia sediminis]|uniref:Uncharacterized protein n=1 Tax=Siminovitchia sediminis TaxID=1274353 RepID=A0ABW4KLA5_9BACI